jgi:hypothetical protein
MDKKFGFLSSSVDPQQLSLTVESAVKLIGVLIGGYATLTHMNGFIFGQVELQAISDAIVVIITSALAIYQSSQLIFGLFRKGASMLG